MAALFRGVAKRAAVIRSAVKSASTSTKSATLPESFASKSTLQRPRLPQLPRLGCAESLLPLHSAVATARMTSCLTSVPRSCRALSQGT